jgi:hypothetical protein
MSFSSLRRPGRSLVFGVLAATLVLGAAAASLVGTSLVDFSQPGTQPLTLAVPIVPPGACYFCHGGFDPEDAPFDRWAGSMMANATRDPIFHAALAVANQDAGDAGELCIRCHAPGGWLAGNSTPPDGTALSGFDYAGVSCNFCHRLVDPLADPANPLEDPAIVAALQTPLTDPQHNGQYVVDPEDRRRGPFDPSVCQNYHEARQSPYHQEALLCSTCHEVSNPAYSRVGGPVPAATDTYVLNDLGVAHPTQVRYDEFPVERTYSEWAQSAFAQGPVEMGGLFGGTKTAVSTCQDCHMPDTSGSACPPGFGAPVRTDLPQHDFNGANSWVPLSVFALDQSLLLYDGSEASGAPLELFQDAVARNVSMLQRASDLAVTQDGATLNVRITNNTGHKLPSGYPEGRRMWINVRFRDAQGLLVAEYGAYDTATATLTADNTKVYEAELGLDAAAAALTGLPEDATFHFALNNKVYKDNRIPPRGFTNAGFESVQALPVGETYADGEYWDDTAFPIPCEAASVVVRVLHQTTSREYIEFLRDENVTNAAGQIAYDEWVAHGKSTPVTMDQVGLALGVRLSSATSTISVASGGAQSMCLSAGPAHAGKLYWMLGSLHGTTPGMLLGGVQVPLNYDPYMQFTILNPNTPPLANGLGLLDGSGRAAVTFAIPPGLGPVLVGLHADHAFGVVTGNSAVAASNPVGLDFLP